MHRGDRSFVTRLLAIDTAGPILGVALLQDGIIHHTADKTGPLRHVEQIVPRIDNALSRLGWTTGDLTSVAVSAGPGSFTGLRVGMAAAKAIALAHDVPLISVDTLEALAATEQHLRGTEKAPPTDLIVPVTDARKSRFYTACFANTPELPRLTEDADVTREELLPIIQRLRSPETRRWCAPGPMDQMVREEPGYVAAVAHPVSAAPGAALRGYVKMLHGAADTQYQGPFYLRPGDIGKAGSTPRFAPIYDSERSEELD